MIRHDKAHTWIPHEVIPTGATGLVEHTASGCFSPAGNGILVRLASKGGCRSMPITYFLEWKTTDRT